MSYVEKLNPVLTRAILTQSRYRENGTHTGKVVIKSQTSEKLQRRAKEGVVGKKEQNDSINLVLQGKLAGGSHIKLLSF